MSAIGREATAWKDGRLWRQSLHFRLLGHLQGVVHFDPQIPNRALQFGVTQQELDGPEVLRAPVDQRRLGAAESVRAVGSRINTSTALGQIGCLKHVRQIFLAHGSFS